MIINKLINSYNIPALNRSVNSSLKKGFTGDEFVKSTSSKPISQSGSKDEKSFSEFKKWAEETDFLSKIGEITTATGKILGSGFEGTTYSIPDNDKWVIKVYKRSCWIPVARTKAEIFEIKDRTPDLNIGQTIARAEVPLGKNASYSYYILKKQNGNSFGVHYKEADDIDDFNVRIHNQCLKTLSEFPQSSFDKCVRDVAYVTEQGYEFDTTNPHNFMVEKENKRINFVDINDLFKGDGTQFGEVLFSLLDGNFGINFSNSDKYPEERELSELYTNRIIKKYFESMKKHGFKFTNGRNFDRLLSSSILNNVLHASETDKKIDELKKMDLM